MQSQLTRSQCMRRAALLALVAIGSLTAGGGNSADACSVPVFRYALLWWNAKHPVECYQVIVFHRGDVSDATQAQIDRLKALEWPSEGGANFTLYLFDLDDESLDEEARALWNEQKDPTAPWMVVRYPRDLEIDQQVWAGTLETSAVDQLLDSPKRQELVRRVLAGDSAVWILLNSGDPQRDKPAADLLAKHLKRLEGELQLPTEEDDPIDTPEDRALEEAALDPGLPPLRLGFSMIEVDRDDPQEQFLVRMLLRSESDLESDYGDKPMAFAMFGRGRTLWGLIDEGIKPEVIEDACAYLTGSCSCQIKAQNPGFDLLLHVNWEQMFENAAEDGADQPVAMVGARLPGVIEAPTEVAGASALDSSRDAGGDAMQAAAASAGDDTDADPTSNKDQAADGGEAAAGTDAQSRPTNSLLVRNLLVALGGSAILLIVLSVFVKRNSTL